MGDRATPTHPLSNRVTPTGELIATPHRGTMYGNRGVLHDDDLVLVRRHQVRRWIVCVLEFRGRRRTVLQPRRFTELFFLDEAVALAAGHRPCAECRHTDYHRFRTAWTTAHELVSPPTADGLDRVLHPQRLLRDGARITEPGELAQLPDGAFIRWRDGSWLWHAGRLHRWTPAGYVERREAIEGPVRVLTPPSTVATIRAGYRPGVHPSADPG